jgi:coenzyme PQQ precursor peptide PqqA
MVEVQSRWAEIRVRKTPAAPALLGPYSRKESLVMREWHKPTIVETESGMEVTSYLPAELDRA